MCPNARAPLPSERAGGRTCCAQPARECPVGVVEPRRGQGEQSAPRRDVYLPVSKGEERTCCAERVRALWVR
jgi:hypothetical protein